MHYRKRGFLWLVVLAVTMFCIQTSAYSAGTIELPKTGQTKCYDGAGAERSCAGTGEDGEYQNGAGWPSPRFNDNGDGTITDRLTGLMWLKDGSCFSPPYYRWQPALDTVADFNMNPTNYDCQDYDESSPPYSDWRLPNINELESLFNSGYGEDDCGGSSCSNNAEWLNSQGFVDMLSSYGTSNGKVYFQWDRAWNVGGGFITASDKTNFRAVFPVRAGQQNNPDPAFPANVWDTGQQVCSDNAWPWGLIPCAGTGQDGEYQMGVDWPDPRFMDNGDGRIIDYLTGLVWLKDAFCFGRMNWQDALDTVADFNMNPTNYDCQDYDEGNPPYSEWRLPNYKELRSLIDYSQWNQALQSGNPFVNTTDYYYWSSTTETNSPDRAWAVDFDTGWTYSNYNKVTWPYVSVLPAHDAVFDFNALPSPVNFRGVEPGTSSDVVITVINNGNINLIIGSIPGTDTVEAPFSIVAGQDYCSGQTLAPGQTCTITARFLPPSLNAFNDTFDIPVNSPEGAVIVNLAGRGTLPAPTMTEWGMIIFVILAGLGSVYYLKTRKIV